MKESFRRLCLQYHPDKCAPDLRGVAEERFRGIKSAYDEILKGGWSEGAGLAAQGLGRTP